MNKKNAIVLTIFIIFLGLLVSGGTYAYWSWNSSVNKNVVFNTAKDLREYIVYDEGNSSFIGSLEVGNTYTQGIHSTISIRKTAEAANIDLIASIMMDINTIGNNMAVSPALKWAVTNGDSNSVGSVLAHGNFVNSYDGETLTLYPSIVVTTTEQKFTVWIWLDANENPSSALSGETLDTVVWTQIDQVEGAGDKFEITRIDANNQVISATAVNNQYNITNYTVTTTDSTPSSWTNIASNEQAHVYTLNYTVSATGTYYVWFKDSNNNIVNRSVVVSTVDTTGPTCTFGSFSRSAINDGGHATIYLTCMDTESTILYSNLSVNDFTVSGNYATVTDVSKEAVANGYKYTITLTGTSNSGSVTVTLPQNKVKNAFNYGNDSVISGSITVDNTKPVCTVSAPTTVVFGNTATSTVTCTDNYAINSQVLSVNNFTTSSTAYAKVLSVTDPVSVTNGYQYTVAVETLKPGSYTLRLVADSISDVAGNKNILTTSASATVSKDTCPVPTNVQIASDGVVTFTEPTVSIGSISFQISMNSSTSFVAFTNGSSYLGKITASVGSRTVYVRSVCNATYYNTPSATASATTTVYTVTLYAATGGGMLIYNNPEDMDGAYDSYEKSVNVISGGTAYLYASPDTNYVFEEWVEEVVGGTLTERYSNETTITNIEHDAYIQPIFGTINYVNNSTNDYYSSLRNALYFVRSDEEIQVLRDVTEDTDATLGSGVDGVILDLNGKVIDMSSYSLINRGELDIYSSASGGILEGNDNSSTGGVITNNGSLTTNLSDDANSIIIRGKNSLIASTVIYNTGTVILYENTILTFNTAISNCTTTSYRYVIRNKGVITVSGANIVHHTDSTWCQAGIVNTNANSRIVVNSGSIDTGGLSINNYAGTGTTNPAVTINGGTVRTTLTRDPSTNPNCAIYNYTSGTILVTSGYIEGTRYGICSRTNSTITIGNDNGVVSTTLPEIKTFGTANITFTRIGSTNIWQEYSSVYYNEGTLVNNRDFQFYDGKLVATNGSTFKYDPNLLPTDYYLYTTTEGTTETTVLKTKYTINYNLDGGTAGTDAPTSVFSDTDIHIDNPTKSGYTFIGWSSSSGAGLSASAKTGISTNPSVTWTGTNITNSYFKNLSDSGGTVTLTANWTNSSTVNYVIVDNGQTYATLSDVFDDVSSNQTVRALKNVNESNNTAPVLDTNKTGVKFDLNGHTINLGNNSIVNNGELDIYNGSSTDGILDGSSSVRTVGVITNNGNLMVNNINHDHNVKITSSSSAANSTVIYVDAGSVTLNENCTLTYSTVASGNRYLVLNGNILTINGASLVYDSNITNTYDRAISFDGYDSTLVINFGTISSGGHTINYNFSSSSLEPVVTINGGTIESGQRVIAMYASTAGIVHITGGILHSTGANAIWCAASGNVTVNIDGGTFTSDSDNGIVVGGCNHNIAGGTVTGAKSGVNNVSTGVLTVGDLDLVPTDTNPVISSTASSGAYYGVENDGTFNYYGGKITSTLGTGYSIKSTPTNIYPNYSVSKTTSDGIETAKLVPSTSTLIAATGIINGTDDGASTGTFLNTNIVRNTITSITFSNQLNSCTINNSTCYDVSSTQDGSVKMYGSNGSYTISQNGGVVLPYNSSSLFYNLVNLVDIDIAEASLPDLINVNNMSYMFYGDALLESVYFERGNSFSATNIEGMFSGCTSLEFVGGFDSFGSPLTNINNIFLNVPALGNDTLDEILYVCSVANVASSNKNADYLGLAYSYYDGKFNNSSLSNYNSYLNAGWEFWR